MKYCSPKFWLNWLFWLWVEIAVAIILTIGGFWLGFMFVDMLTLSALNAGLHL